MLALYNVYFVFDGAATGEAGECLLLLCVYDRGRVSGGV